MVMPGKLLAGGTCQTCMMREGSSKGSGRRRTALTTEKIAVLAPIPRASTTMAAAEKPGLRRSKRREKWKSESRFRKDIQTLLLAHCPRRATVFRTEERTKSSQQTLGEAKHALSNGMMPGIVFTRLLGLALRGSHAGPQEQSALPLLLPLPEATNPCRRRTLGGGRTSPPGPPPGGWSPRR